MINKKHRNEPGYIAERANPFVQGEKVTIYHTKKSNRFLASAKYVTICDAHDCFHGSSSTPNARHLMKNPDQFCRECKEIAAPESVDTDETPPAQITTALPTNINIQQLKANIMIRPELSGAWMQFLCDVIDDCARSEVKNEEFNKEGII